VACFIASQRDAHGVPQAVSCRALGVSQSWSCKWKQGELPPRTARRERLKAEIARLFAAREGKDGSPRITAALRDDGWRVSENTVAALMREQGLAARRRKKRKATTRPGKGRWRAPDQVKRKFGVDGINRRWYGDGTEIATNEGKLYLLVTWNHCGVSSHPEAAIPVASPRADGDGGLAGDGCGVVWQVAGSGAARAGCGVAGDLG
jgi:putative transposase